MPLVNLTPHDVVIGSMNAQNTFEVAKTLPKDDKVARVNTNMRPVDPIDGVAVQEVKFLEVVDLPPKQEGVRYIVSMPVAQYAKTRDDLLCPYSEKAIRDGQKILGVPGLVRYEAFPEMKRSTADKVNVNCKKIINSSFTTVSIGRKGDEGKFVADRFFPKSDNVATVKTEAHECEPIDGIRLFSIKFFGIQNLPSEEEGVVHIVPMPVAQFSERKDLVCADTEKPFRDEKGAMVGFPGFVRYA